LLDEKREVLLHTHQLIDGLDQALLAEGLISRFGASELPAEDPRIPAV
jgi:hypothetical protein